MLLNKNGGHATHHQPKQRNLMKKLDTPHHITIKDLTQEKIGDLEEDLITVLEAHMDVVEFEAVFKHILMFMTKALYDIAPSHKEAYRVLHEAMNEGIKNHVSKHMGV
jgi:hypothetical protein